MIRARAEEGETSQRAVHQRGEARGVDGRARSSERVNDRRAARRRARACDAGSATSKSSSLPSRSAESPQRILPDILGVARAFAWRERAVRRRESGRARGVARGESRGATAAAAIDRCDRPTAASTIPTRRRGTNDFTPSRARHGERRGDGSAVGARSLDAAGLHLVDDRRARAVERRAARRVRGVHLRTHVATSSSSTSFSTRGGGGGRRRRDDVPRRRIPPRRRRRRTRTTATSTSRHRSRSRRRSSRTASGEE